MKPHPLKMAREARGWSQTKVAQALGVNTRTVGRWELRLVVPHPHYREQLSMLFGKTIQELGLLSDSDENDVLQEVPHPASASLAPEVPAQAVPAQAAFLDDPAIPEISVAQQWLTNSLAGNFQVHAEETHMHAGETHMREWDTRAYEEDLFSHRFLWETSIPRKKSVSKFRAFYRFPWPSLLIPSALFLLAILVAMAVPMANRLSFPRVEETQVSSTPVSTDVGDISGPPLYILTVQNVNPSLQYTAQHLQNVFNAVYPQLVNRFALDPHSAAVKNVTLAFSSDPSSPVAAKGTIITINAHWMLQHPTNVGLFTHELTLVVEQYPSGAPAWFSDGMADYARSVYGPADDDDWSLPNGVQPQDSYTQGGGVAARFLLWLEQHTTLDIVDQLNHALQTQQSFSDAFHRLTHHTVDDLWSQYQANSDITLTPEQLYKTVTSRKLLYQSSFRVRILHWHTFKPIFVPRLYMSNFAIQADMTMLSGNGVAGFIFRSQNVASYYLRISPDGTYGLKDQNRLLAVGFSGVILKGLNQTNRLTIVAQKHTFYLYINSQFITKVDDSGSSYGAVGVMALDETKVTNVIFENVQVF